MLVRFRVEQHIASDVGVFFARSIYDKRYPASANYVRMQRPANVGDKVYICRRDLSHLQGSTPSFRVASIDHHLEDLHLEEFTCLLFLGDIQIAVTNAPDSSLAKLNTNALQKSGKIYQSHPSNGNINLTPDAKLINADFQMVLHDYWVKEGQTFRLNS